MSEAMKLGDAMKAATETTSLNSSDRLLAFGSDGELKKVSRANFLANSRESELQAAAYLWYTVMESSATEPYGGILCISSGEWCGTPCLHIFAIGGRYGGSGAMWPKIVSLLGTTSDIKLRVVKSGGVMRIDAYTYSRRLRVHATGNIALSAIVKDPDIPADATVKEYVFSTSVDGGG